MSEMMSEEMPNHEAETIAPLGVQDRPWMEHFGCTWPEAENEADWLGHVNGLVQVGDTNMRNMTTKKHDEVRESIVNARASFINLLPRLRPDIIERSREYQSFSAPDTGTTPSNLIDVQRELQVRSIDGLRLININPPFLVMTKQRIIRLLDNLEAYGIDSAAVANSGRGTIFNLAPESLSARLQPFYAAARAAGWQDYRDKANAFIDTRPEVLGYRPDKTRTLTRIIASTAIGSRPGVAGLESVAGLYIDPLEQTIVSYLQHGDVIRSVSGLRRHNYYNRSLGKEEMLGIIAANADDPVVKAYLKGYPIDDIEATKEVYARHIRSRERRKGHYPLLYQGPTLLADPGLSSARAYASVLENPEFNPEHEDGSEKYDIPRLTAEQQAEMDVRIREADAAAIAAEVELRDLAIRHDPDEITVLVARKEYAKEVRRALVVRHLGMVIDIADTCNRVADRADVVGTANVVLARFAMEEYDPDSSLATFEEQAREAVYAALAGYHPKRIMPKPANPEQILADDMKAYPALTPKLPWSIKEDPDTKQAIESGLVEHNDIAESKESEPEVAEVVETVIVETHTASFPAPPNDLPPTVNTLAQKHSRKPASTPKSSSSAVRSFSPAEQDAVDLAESAGTTAKRVRTVIKKLVASGELNNLEPAATRKREGGRTTSHYKGRALEVITEALIADTKN